MTRFTHINGYDYYDTLPENARPGTIRDFVGPDGKKRIGMEYLVFSHTACVYHVNVVRERTTGQKIKMYEEAGILYVFTNQDQ